MWRSNYEMTPDAFSKEVDRCGCRSGRFTFPFTPMSAGSSAEKYAKDVVSEDQPIPAHVLGNMWAQQWNQHLPAARACQHG